MASSVALRSVVPHFPPLPALRDFIYMYRMNADKTLSQNYLMDMNLTRKMVRRAGDLTDAFVVEVGPGPGGITRAILEQPCKRLDVVEIDKQFLMPLQHLSNHSMERMNIHRADVLKFDIEQMWTDAGAAKCSWVEERPPFHIIGNLPFQVSTPLVIKMMRQMSIRRGPFVFGRVPLTFTLQSEVARRVVGEPCSEFRSRIGVTCQNQTVPRILFNVPGKCFTPRPDIDVCVVQFLPRLEPLIPTAYIVADKVFRTLFHYKRRFLGKAVQLLYPRAVALEMAHHLLKHTGIDQEELITRLGMDELAAITLCYEKQCRKTPGLFHFDFRHPMTLDVLAEEFSDDPFPPKYSKPTIELEQIDNEGMTLEQFGNSFGWSAPAGRKMSRWQMADEEKGREEAKDNFDEAVNGDNDNED
ncbi:hypothetical protein niasHT_020158 [Heterodera trifolii]|uniref:rRNA adenine N(6)-methyltransferase n=1 Tax=Heterodera trifolii TaxID=157864 RepID=A0ABD2KHZ0_9BILA